MMSCSKGLEHKSLDALTVVEKSTKSLITKILISKFSNSDLSSRAKINNFEKENSNLSYRAKINNSNQTFLIHFKP